MATQVARVPKPYWFGSLPDHALMQELRASHDQDRAHTARLVALLAELDRRRLHRQEGYASLYRYCVGALGMSEDVAWKRIETARRARRFPEIFAMLADGRLHVSAVVLVGRHLTRENASELLGAVANRSKRAIEELLAERFPQPDLACSITSVLTLPTVAPSTVAAPAPGAADAARVLHDATSPAPGRVPDICRSGGDASTPPTAVAPPPPSPRLAPLSPERFALQVTLSRETHAKLRRAQELLGHAMPSQDISQVLDRALALLVAQLEQRRCGATETPRARRSHANGRYVPAEVRREVFTRDGHQCTFGSDKNHRCEARSRLELDHVIPLAKGGRTEAANLRLLCHSHNQHAAESEYGEGFMSAKRSGVRGDLDQERRGHSAHAT